jgi:DNA mismatch repair ATPase MutL
MLVVLPETCISRLRSSAAGVTTLAAAAEELVCNALDAGATRIHVTLDAKHAAVRCEDNGSGVPASHVALLATRYATSKGANLDAQEGGRTLGFKGEALASLAGAHT